MQTEKRLQLCTESSLVVFPSWNAPLQAADATINSSRNAKACHVRNERPEISMEHCSNGELDRAYIYIHIYT